MKIRSLLLALAAGIILMIISCNNSPKKQTDTNAAEVWNIEKSPEWGRMQNWFRGCNYIPSSAVNQLEMWQAETFDTTTIARELRWADEIGLNCMRVFLH
ncbi:MAG: 1,4-beta-xylanase, partial [Bacteroidia bacterium]|nr:1,4-beta-xylanase [Bacteroidia bacterium]